jgi:hypothetical protein
MKKERNTQQGDLTGRIKSLEQFTGSLVARRAPEAEAIPINDEPVAQMPTPRRSRVFLRHGEGHGVFADLTITAPLARAAIE